MFVETPNNGFESLRYSSTAKLQSLAVQLLDEVMKHILSFAENSQFSHYKSSYILSSNRLVCVKVETLQSA